MLQILVFPKHGLNCSYLVALTAVRHHNLRVLQSLPPKGLLLVPYVRIIEMFPPSFRVRSHLGSAMLWCLGLVLVGPLAYILPNWRHLQLVMSLLAAPLIVLVW